MYRLHVSTRIPRLSSGSHAPSEALRALPTQNPTPQPLPQPLASRFVGYAKWIRSLAAATTWADGSTVSTQTGPLNAQRRSFLRHESWHMTRLEQSSQGAAYEPASEPHIMSTHLVAMSSCAAKPRQ